MQQIWFLLRHVLDKKFRTAQGSRLTQAPLLYLAEIMQVIRVDYGHSRFFQGIIICCQGNAGLLQLKSSDLLLSQ